MSKKHESDLTQASTPPTDSATKLQSTETTPLTFQQAAKNAGTERTQSIHGLATDPTPDSHYTVAGVTSGKPTPETDLDHAIKTREVLTDMGEKLPVAAHKSLQKAADIEAAQGFRGEGVDDTPNESYTVKGVLHSQPTPETNDEASKRAHQITGSGLSGLETAHNEKAKAKK